MGKILLVDDENHILEYYEEELSKEGHKIVAINTGDELLGMIEFHQPDLLVLDIKLVEWDGLELLKEIRNHCYELPVILCSAYDTYKEDFRSFGADDYVVKSFDLTELKSKIRRCLEPLSPI